MIIEISKDLINLIILLKLEREAYFILNRALLWIIRIRRESSYEIIICLQLRGRVSFEIWKHIYRLSWRFILSMYNPCAYGKTNKRRLHKILHFGECTPIYAFIFPTYTFPPSQNIDFIHETYGKDHQIFL